MNGISGLNAYYSFSGGGSYGGSYGIAAAVRKAQASGQMPTYGTQRLRLRMHRLPRSVLRVR